MAYKKDFALCFHPQPIFIHHLCLLWKETFPIINPHQKPLKKSNQFIHTIKHRNMHQCHHLFCNFSCRYKFWLTNGEPWDFFHYHFSADEFYILPILMVVELMMWQKMIVILLFWQRAIKAFLWHIEQVYGVFNLILLILTFKSAIQVRNTELCLKQACNY